MNMKKEVVLNTLELDDGHYVSVHPFNVHLSSFLASRMRDLRPDKTGMFPCFQFRVAESYFKVSRAPLRQSVTAVLHYELLL